MIAKTADFIGLAGSVPVPAAKRSTPWDEVVRRARGQAERSGVREIVSFDRSIDRVGTVMRREP